MMTETARPSRFQPIHGLNKPEDLFLLDGTDWVLAGDMGNSAWAAGGFHLINHRDRTHAPLKPDFSRPARPPFEGSTPPDPALFSVHGIDVTPLGDQHFRVLAVNHGERHSIEIFELDCSGAQPALTWIGAAVMPNGQVGNAVALLPGDGLAVTVTLDNEDPQSFAKASAGQPSGFVLEWSPDRGWSTTPGSELSGDNGLIASADGAWLYIAAYCEGAVYKLSRNRAPYVRQRVSLNFLPDNLRLSPKGYLLATGHAAVPFESIVAVSQSESPTCPVPTAVARIQPETLKSELLLIEEHTADFGGGTSTIVVGEELWMGSFHGRCVATIPLRAIGNPDL